MKKLIILAIAATMFAACGKVQNDNVQSTNDKINEEMVNDTMVNLSDRQKGLAAHSPYRALDLKSHWPMGKPNDAYAQYFTGKSYLADVNGIHNVTFEPRCRNNWHIHHGAVQVLICVYGRGWYQEWGKPAVELHEGVVIEIPEGVKHWHGAAADSWMQHLTYHKNAQPDASNEWLEPVTDEQYNQVQ